MVCGLTAEELFILNVLYQHRCINSNRSKNLGEIAKAFQAKFNQNPEDVARGLASKGYVALIRKKDIKYYISNMAKACNALNCHGYNATSGRILPGRVRKL
jgi:hypothetical protein